jgi:hypothetical protein
MCLVNQLSCIAHLLCTLLYFTLSNTRIFYLSSRVTGVQWVKGCIVFVHNEVISTYSWSHIRSLAETWKQSSVQKGTYIKQPTNTDLQRCCVKVREIRIFLIFQFSACEASLATSISLRGRPSILWGAWFAAGWILAGTGEDWGPARKPIFHDYMPFRFWTVNTITWLVNTKTVENCSICWFQ